jgi:3-hydroxyacyl-CoA dehydrogenase
VKVAIVGGGSIGVGWAVVFSRAGYDVALHEPDAARRDAIPREVEERAGGRRRGGERAATAGGGAGRGLRGGERKAGAGGGAGGLRGGAGSGSRRAGAVSVHADIEEVLQGAEHVQECAPEDLTVKRAVFETLTALTADIPLASSSSAIVASRFAPGNPRALVAHPGNPPYLLPVVELVPSPVTDPKLVERVERTMQHAGMSPVRVNKEVEGFVFNRLQGAVLREAYCLVRDGVASVDDIDRVMRDGLGRRWAVIGPFETADLNTRGGIEQHAKRLGPAYARMGAERGQDDPWTPELVERVTRERRRLLPLDQWEARVAWRDEQLKARG